MSYLNDVLIQILKNWLVIKFEILFFFFKQTFMLSAH